MRGIALDIGSSRTRAWAPGAGVFADVPSGPVRRGRVTGSDSQLQLLRRLTASAPGGDGHDTVVMLTHPVLAAPEERAAARRLVDALGPARVIAVDSARAAAAYAAPAGGGPLLVVDLGAQLTEVTLVVDGLVEDARLAEVGVDDLPASGGVPESVAGTAADMVSDLWRRDRTGAVRGALRRGVLVTGGGALRLDVTGRLAHLLRARIRLANDPSTSVVRGAGLMLTSALRHPTGAVPRT
ncbi:rod shape-determining protein MreC [Streptomyces sp. SR27]|uniref:rod shape-determining protein MreC n=1 Tax=Streptomyces sp. P9-A4 TaxID=3072285 RepID=UPI00295BE9D2|nr:rod shape-determining protein MreC [Streptomyces sp. SR27]MDV9189406.1 rod shape-determining protein MreC [Streptomyces sp. SR27]